MEIVEIHAEFEGAADVKLAKLAKRAAKYGQAIVWTKEPFGKKAYEVRVPMVRYAVDGEAPRAGDFRFVAELERLDGGVMVTGRRDVDLDGFARDWHGECQHCGKPRARKLGYVVEDMAAGGFKIVGKACLRDYTGQDVPAGAIQLFQWLRDAAAMGDEDDWGRAGGSVITARRRARRYRVVVREHGGVISLDLEPL